MADEEGDLFSFRVVDSSQKRVLPWQVANVRPETTFQQVLEEVCSAVPDTSYGPIGRVQTEMFRQHSGGQASNASFDEYPRCLMLKVRILRHVSIPAGS